MKLSYGKDNSCDIARADVVRIAPNEAVAIAENDVADCVRRALENPLDYPDLASATVPGDRVVVAIEHGVPHIGQVVRGTIDSLRHSGIVNASITVLFSPDSSDDSTLQNVNDVLDEHVSLMVHASDEEALSLLGITEAKRPLRLNRVLCDADLVIPIGVTKSPERLEVSDSFFPDFSDSATYRRFHSPRAYETAAGRQMLDREVGECLWMLGVNLAVQIVPGPRGEIAAVYCGTPTGVQQVAREVYSRLWAAEVEGRADLIVATIVGERSQQTWQNVSRALAVADKLLEPGGAIAICTELSARPGPSGKRLRDAPDLDKVERNLLKDEFADSVSVLALCRSLQRGTVYLKSRLDSALVESLGFAPIESDDELERLTRRYRRCVVLEEAQYLEPKLVV